MVESIDSFLNPYTVARFYSFQNPNTVASFDYIEELIAAGADVNAPDRIGQRVLHEVARDWGDDIAQYLIDKVMFRILSCLGYNTAVKTVTI